MASVQVRLTTAWQIGKGNNKYDTRNEIILGGNSVPGLFARLFVNIHTPECFCTGLKKAMRHEKQSDIL